MELKKSSKANLENKRNLFLLAGLVVALGLCLVAFEWNTKVEEVASLGTVELQAIEEEIIPITRPEEVKPPPPPPPKVADIINIVEDDADIDEQLDIDDTEADDQTVIEVAPIIQREQETAEENEVFFVVEDMPEFPGGEIALRKFISNAIKYPVVAQENGIQGKVYVTFVVDQTGSVTDTKIARGIDASLDKEAIRVINSLPKWKPGMQRGKPVKVSFTVPISFVLQ